MNSTYKEVPTAEEEEDVARAVIDALGNMLQARYTLLTSNSHTTVP
jgi:hypothetical protein